MANLSQESAPVTTVTTSSSSASSAPAKALTATASPAASAVKLTVTDYQSQLKSGTLLDTIKKSGKSPEAWIQENVAIDEPSHKAGSELKQETQSSLPTQPQTTEQPAPEVNAPPLPVEGDFPDPKTTEEFVKSLQDLGFHYTSPKEALRGYVNKEQAVNTYRTKSRELLKQLDEAHSGKSQDQQRIKLLETQLNEQKKQQQQIPSRQQQEQIPQLPPIPKFPEVVLLDDSEKEEVDKFNKTVQTLLQATEQRHQLELQQLRQEVGSIKTEFSTKAQEMENKVKTYERLQAEAKERQQQEEYRTRVFSAVEDLVKVIPEYKPSKPFKLVDEEYRGLIADISYLQREYPQLAQVDVVAEHFGGNKSVNDILEKHDIHISSDIEKYVTMVALERDATAHKDFDETGRPDLQMALLRQKKNRGIIKQELVNARTAGYEDAERINARFTQGPATIPPTRSGEPPAAANAMNVDQIRAKLAQINREPNSTKQKEMLKLIEPELAKIGFNPSMKG